MNSLKLEEMIVNAILNPQKKFTHKSWLDHEYIYWSDGESAKCFKDESNCVEDIIDYASMIDGWQERGN